MPEDIKTSTRRLESAYIEAFYQLELLITETGNWVNSIKKHGDVHSNMYIKANKILTLLNEAANIPSFSADDFPELLKSKFIRFDEIITRSTLPLRRKHRLQNIVSCFCTIKTELPNTPKCHYIHEDIESMINIIKKVIDILEIDEILYRRVITKRANTRENANV